MSFEDLEYSGRASTVLSTSPRLNFPSLNNLKNMQATLLLSSTCKWALLLAASSISSSNLLLVIALSQVGSKLHSFNGRISCHFPSLSSISFTYLYFPGAKAFLSSISCSCFFSSGVFLASSSHAASRSLYIW